MNTPRPAVRAVLPALAFVAILVGVGVAVIKYTPGRSTATAPASPAATGVPTGSTARPNQVTTDLQTVQRSLIGAGEPWEFAMGGFTQADASGQGAGSQATTRAQSRAMRVVIASENISLLRGFIAGGHAGEQAYCEKLLDNIRALGYTNLQQALVGVFFGENDLHAQLTWSRDKGYAYTILDNDVLSQALNSPRPGASPPPAVTPLPAPPAF